MFKLQRTPSYWWPVTVKFPVDSTAEKGGQWEEEDFEVLFPRMDQPQLAAIVAEVNTGAAPAAELAARLTLDWRGVIAADGTTLRHSKEAVASVYRLPGVPQAVWEAFIKSHAGAAAGN